MDATRELIIEQVMLALHPWLNPVRRSGHTEWEDPPRHEVLAAAEQLVIRLEDAGYQIVVAGRVTDEMVKAALTAAAPYVAYPARVNELMVREMLTAALRAR